MSKIINTYKKHKESLTKTEQVAVWMTERIGTIRFFFIILTWTILWLGFNILAPAYLRFDPFPAFVLWLFISNMIQIFLMPLIMVGQNLQGKHSEIRAENDYQINLKAEKEIAELKHKLDSILTEIKSIKN